MSIKAEIKEQILETFDLSNDWLQTKDILERIAGAGVEPTIAQRAIVGVVLKELVAEHVLVRKQAEKTGKRGRIPFVYNLAA